MVTKETYEKALQVIEEYKGRNPRELNKQELGVLASAQMIAQRYREENPEQ